MPVKWRIILVIAIALSGTRFAVAETEEGRQACMNDAFQFCGDAMPDRERVFRCLEARKHQISAACRANMPAEPAPQRAATKRLAPAGKNAEHKAPMRTSLSQAGQPPALKKHTLQTKSAAHRAPTTKRAANTAAPADPKPLSLAPAKGH